MVKGFEKQCRNIIGILKLVLFFSPTSEIYKIGNSVTRILSIETQSNFRTIKEAKF